MNSAENDLREMNALRIAREMVAGFDKHYRLFRECSAAAKTRFERADWLGVQNAVRERIQFYDDRVEETIGRLKAEFGDRKSTRLNSSHRL